MNKLRITSRNKVIKIAKSAEEKKGEDIVILDVREKFFITQYFVIISATSIVHIKALQDVITDIFKPIHIEGTPSSKWVLLDMGDAVVHIFDNDTRKYYNLERLWGDVPHVRYKSIRKIK